MFYVFALLLVVLNTCSLSLVVIGLPGSWLIIISTLLFAWWQGPHVAGGVISTATILVMVALAVLGEVMEFGAGVVGSKRAGGSRRGSVGALVGGVVGAIAATFLIPVPVVGSVIGACAGAFLGALAMELSGGRDLAASLRSGIGAGQGRLLGTLAKIGVGAALWVIATVAVFWP